MGKKLEELTRLKKLNAELLAACKKIRELPKCQVSQKAPGTQPYISGYNQAMDECKDIAGLAIINAESEE